MPEHPTATLFEPQWARRIAVEGTAFGGDEAASLPLFYGLPDPALFPGAELAAAAARVVEDPSVRSQALLYGPSRGQAALVDLIREKLARDEDLNVPSDGIMVTTGSMQGLALAARALVDEGDTVLVEGPSFPGAMAVFRRTGADLQALPMGPHGLDVAAAEGVISGLLENGVRPRLLYTMPTFHNPTGLTMPEANRGALLALARHFNLMILEDDAYSDLHYDSASGPLPTPLYALDREQRVIRTGTFSKIIAPGLRVGWVLGPPEVIRRMGLLKEEWGTAPFVQHIIVEYSKDGALSRHIATLVDAYRLKRDAMFLALERYFPPEARWTRPAGGFFIWVTLPPAVDPEQLKQLAREEGVNYLPGEQCFAGEPPADGTFLRLAFTYLSIDEIEEATKRLGRAIRTLL